MSECRCFDPSNGPLPVGHLYDCPFSNDLVVLPPDTEPVQLGNGSKPECTCDKDEKEFYPEGKHGSECQLYDDEGHSIDCGGRPGYKGICKPPCPMSVGKQLKVVVPPVVLQIYKQQLLNTISDLLGDMKMISVENARDIEVRPDFSSKNLFARKSIPGPNEHILIDGPDFTIEIRKGPFAKSDLDIEGGKLVERE